MDTPLFLSADELYLLTGFKFKAKQITQLRTMGIAFRINGCGRPVVTRSAIEGGKESKTSQKQKQEWQPTLLQFDPRAA
ncbi:MAG: DUF4224 domain-containing protein [Sideroxydans sp.]|nr:DUF4224 domain-containing protein [Sideroxydans sp.]MDD5056691.1 DUF4224 domain-containing protein [Sideroxydans sp.]